jgi:transcriptional regulator with XRE-family HTH domain
VATHLEVDRVGRQRRPQPKYLAKKLKQIRLELGLGQVAMATRLGKVEGNPDGAMISRFERGEREPNLFVIVAYARVAGINAQVIIDDDWNVKDLISAMPKDKKKLTSSGRDGRAV